MAQVHEPASEADILALVRWALAEQQPLEILGAGTKRGIGRPLETRHQLSMRRCSGICEYEPTELYVTAAAGTPLMEIEAALVEKGQHLAFEPRDLAHLFGGDGAQTVGGAVAAGLSGPRRYVAGGVRDHLLGFRAVSGRGEAFKSGGRVVKNVTGYDLSKLIAGSFGTLAVLSEVTLRVAPRPRQAATLLVTGRAYASAAAIYGCASATGSATGLAYVSTAGDLGIGADSDGPAAAIRLEGDTARIAAATLKKKIGADCSLVEGDRHVRVWSAIRDLRLLRSSASNLWRLSLPRSAMEPFVAKLVPHSTFIVDWAGRQIWMASDMTGDDLRRIVFETTGPDGHATLIRGPAELRRTIPVFNPQPPALAALAKSVKGQFDPMGVLNPGRMTPDL
jgi:glycolate oxidase FAD binding subunit